jgi:DNA-binding transcriptional ArsR family regulator
MIESAEDDILKLLERGPVTPDEVAASLGTAWATAQGLLLKLVGMGKVSVSRKGRVNVYFMKEARRITPSMPSWARPKSLRQLSDELEVYFQTGVSAAEMIERERRQS